MNFNILVLLYRYIGQEAGIVSLSKVICRAHQGAYKQQSRDNRLLPARVIIQDNNIYYNSQYILIEPNNKLKLFLSVLLKHLLQSKIKEIHAENNGRHNCSKLISCKSIFKQQALILFVMKLISEKYLNLKIQQCPKLKEQFTTFIEHHLVYSFQNRKRTKINPITNKNNTKFPHQFLTIIYIFSIIQQNLLYWPYHDSWRYSFANEKQLQSSFQAVTLNQICQQFQYQMNYSPIRTLDPRDSSLERLKRLKYESLRDYRLEEENIRLRTAVQRNNTDSIAREYLSRKSIENLVIENQGLNRDLVYNMANTARIQSNVNLLIAQNEGLKDRLMAQEANKVVEVQDLRRKYMHMQMLGRSELEQTYAQQIGLLLREIDRLKILVGEKSVELQVQFKERLQEKQQYDSNICKYIAELNNYKNQLLIQQSQKNQEIRQLNAKTQLQRSRTVGIIGSSKQSTTFMDRQIRKLAEEISEKNIQLDTLTKNFLAQKKKNDEQTKVFNDRVTKLMAENQETLRQRMLQFEKRQDSLKQEILDQKRKQTELYMKIDQMEKEYQALQHEYELLQRDFNDNQNQTRTLKQVIEKLREQHLQQITKLMNQKIRRRSSKMLSSQRSLNSSLKDSNIVGSRQDIGSPSAGDRLPIVREEVYLRQSKQSQEMHNKSLLQHDVQQEDTDYNALINHYQNMIEQLKKSHNVDMQVMKLEMEKLKKQLSEKQEQFEDILKRFTPLVKIHAGQKTIEQDRKERIERHWKADIALLEILLDKYKIQAF